MNQRKFAPFYVQLLIGGVDLEGSHIYSLDAAGGSIPDRYTSTGSGSIFVYGVLEDRYHDDITVNEGLDLAIRGISAAMKRDAASGDGMNVCSITADKGYVQLSPEQVAQRRQRLGIR
ncbi:MAG TPA: proteasome subunit beta, partial [Candidatus Thermoplasmatota archaeon]|nr:proteasome subunit beta [Candidatus Thermoplasmatota archaeon]